MMEPQTALKEINEMLAELVKDPCQITWRDNMKRITKQERLQVYDKYSGHCAYCGISIDYKDMQVDHLKPVANYRNLPEEEIWSMENYMPACRMCNHYKRQNSLEGFRKMIATIPEKLERDSYIYRVGVRYGNVLPDPKEIKFYFED